MTIVRQRSIRNGPVINTQVMRTQNPISDGFAGGD